MWQAICINGFVPFTKWRKGNSVDQHPSQKGTHLTPSFYTNRCIVFLHNYLSDTCLVHDACIFKHFKYHTLLKRFWFSRIVVFFPNRLWTVCISRGGDLVLKRQRVGTLIEGLAILALHFWNFLTSWVRAIKFLMFATLNHNNRVQLFFFFRFFKQIVIYIVTYAVLWQFS